MENHIAAWKAAAQETWCVARNKWIGLPSPVQACIAANCLVFVAWKGGRGYQGICDALVCRWVGRSAGGETVKGVGQEGGVLVGGQVYRLCGASLQVG